MHALLVQRHDHTEYRVRLVAVNLAVEHREALLQLCRHPDDMARTQECAVLEAVLLEAEPAQRPAHREHGPHARVPDLNENGERVCDQNTL